VDEIAGSPESAGPKTSWSRACLPCALANAAALVVLVALTILFSHATHRHEGYRYAQTRCGNNLKQIALAAMQYADDKRFFPRGTGDATTSDGPKCFAKLYQFNYLDDPAVFVCPSEGDSEVTDYVTPPPGPTWLEQGAHVSARIPPLPELHDLSYGWTRVAFSGNSLASLTLAADRTIRPLWGAGPYGIVGNHRGAPICVSIDAHTSRMPCYTTTAPSFEDTPPKPGLGAKLGVFWEP
jgi:hypothetical protein